MSAVHRDASPNTFARSVRLGSAPASSSPPNYGATKRGSQRLAAQLETILGALEVLPFEAPADAAYGVIRTQLEQAGTPIGGNDLLIAAQALALGCTIVTDNEVEFARIDSLPRENWLRQT